MSKREYTLITIRCRVCGKLFEGHTNAVYCSPVCRKKYATIQNNNDCLIIIPRKVLPKKEQDAENYKNKNYAEIQKQKTLAMMPKIGEEL